MASSPFVRLLKQRTLIFHVFIPADAGELCKLRTAGSSFDWRRAFDLNVRA
jgi:hypothetical protein